MALLLTKMDENILRYNNALIMSVYKAVQVH